MSWELIPKTEVGDFPFTRVKWWSPLTKNPDSGICVRPDESLEGFVVDYNPSQGDSDFNGAPCGYVDLKVTAGDHMDDIARITLDKGPLKDGFKGVPTPIAGQKVRVKFLGKMESTKPGGNSWNDYEVYTDREAYDPSVAAMHNVSTVEA